MFRDIVCTRLSLSHYVDVFQWDRECFIIWAVKLQTRFFMMSKYKFSSHRPRFLCSASHFVFFFDFNITLRLVVSLCWQLRSLDDWEVEEFRLHTENRVLLLRILLGFVEIFFPMSRCIPPRTRPPAIPLRRQWWGWVCFLLFLPEASSCNPLLITFFDNHHSQKILKVLF